MLPNLNQIRKSELKETHINDNANSSYLTPYNWDTILFSDEKV